MKSQIYRNIAIVSAIFIVAFSIMLIVNYFQVSNSDIIHSEMIEKLKQTNEELRDNEQLKEQIRELDLLARKAYFVNIHRLNTGIIILLSMIVVFVLSIRLYFAKTKNIPDKEILPIDDWAIKSKSRKYIVWLTGGLAVAGIAFALLTSPHLKKISNKKNLTEISSLQVSDFENSNISDFEFETQDDLESTDISINTDTTEISKVTHNGFRGNNSLGISSAKNIPTSWNLSTGKNILWKVPVPRKGYNSPVINGNKVFFSGADETARELFCYELNSGKQLWKLGAKNIPGSPAQAPKTTDDTGLAASTVATNGKVVCAIFGTGDVICADMDGKQLWAKNIGVPDNSYGYASSLLIFGNSLIIQYDNRNVKKVMSLNLENGNQRWAKERLEKNPSWSSPAMAIVNNKAQLILVGNPFVTSYNPNTGEENWRVEAMSGEPVPGAAYSNGIIFAAAEYATMVAINATDGTELWRTDEFLPEIASPVATKDFVLIATSYGVVASFNAQTGEMLKSMEFNTDFNASPILADGKIYLVCTDGKVFILSAKGNFSLINSFETKEKTFATPAFTDKKIVIKTEKSIYCVAAEP
jgi:outer membrane protein assembly factor BamB